MNRLRYRLSPRNLVGLLDPPWDTGKSTFERSICQPFVKYSDYAKVVCETTMRPSAKLLDPDGL